MAPTSAPPSAPHPAERAPGYAPRAHQDPANTIAFQGVEGANSDLACRRAYPYMHTLPCASFEDVFEAVSAGHARYGMIPIENSQAGRVAEIHHLLPRSALHIVGEYVQPIQHALMAPAGATLDTIRAVYSHPQALMQCREHLRALARTVQAHDPTATLTTHPYANTAVAAADVARWNDPAKAAIASTLAAELYGLTVLDAHLEDAPDNRTVFIVLAREPADMDPADPAVVTTILFDVRNIPGALYKALGGFATNGINMLKLESYIVPGGDDRAQAQFLMQFSGHPDLPSVERALEELRFFCRTVRVIGVFAGDAAR